MGSWVNISVSWYQRSDGVGVSVQVGVFAFEWVEYGGLAICQIVNGDHDAPPYATRLHLF